MVEEKLTTDLLSVGDGCPTQSPAQGRILDDDVKEGGKERWNSSILGVADGTSLPVMPVDVCELLSLSLVFLASKLNVNLDFCWYVLTSLSPRAALLKSSSGDIGTSGGGNDLVLELLDD